MDPNKQKAALALKNDTSRSISEICQILGVCRNTYYKYIRSEEGTKKETRKEPPLQPVEPAPPVKKTMRVELHLRVEGNNKYIRGKNKVREQIEWRVLDRFQMEKPDEKGWDYILTIPYETDAELDEIVYEEILAEAARIADLRHCFTESDVVSLEDPARSW